MDKKIKKFLIISTSVVFAISFIIFIFQHRELTAKYREATAYAEKGDYEKAVEIVSNIGEYKDSERLLEEYANEINYQQVIKYVQESNFEDALKILERLNSIGGGYKDSGALQDNVEYNRAVQLAENGQLSEAFEAFKNLPTAYADVVERLNELSFAIKFVDKWFCKEHQIDMVIKGTISKENITYLDVEIRDRNGFLINGDSNKLVGEDLILMEDRFLWNLMGGDSKYAVIMQDNKLKMAKQSSTDTSRIFTFVRKLDTYSAIDGNINAALKQKI